MILFRPQSVLTPLPMRIRVCAIVVMLFVGIHGCSKCEMPRSPGASDPSPAPMAMDAESESGDEVGATDAVETQEEPKWESALEPGIGE